MSMAREHGFKTGIATRGDTGLALANDLLPDAITLDLKLPAIDGWSVLDRLKRNARTRHIPVHVISVVDRQRRGISVGAFAYLEKPVSRDALEGALGHISRFLDRSARLLLIVEDNTDERQNIAGMLGEDGSVEVTAVSNSAEALRALDEREYDCMVVDLVLPELDGIRLIEIVKGRPRYKDLPIIVYTGKDLSREEEQELKRDAQSVIVKSGSHSAEKLVSDTALTGPRRARRRARSRGPRSRARARSTGTAWPARRSSSWTMTSATSTRSRACSRATRWRSSTRRTARAASRRSSRTRTSTWS